MPARVICVLNQKGGVGKTTTVLNLGAGLALRGRRVLLVDLDPQANLSHGLNLRAEELSQSVYELLLNPESRPETLVRKTNFERLAAIPSHLDLCGAEVELAPLAGRETRLRRAVEILRPDYDYLLVDCAPNLSLLTVNALVAASEALVPLQAHPFGLEGVGKLLEVLQLVRESLNPNLKLTGVLVTLYDNRTNVARQVLERLKQDPRLGPHLFETLVRCNIRIAESQMDGVPVIHFDAACPAAQAYLALSDEILEMESSGCTASEARRRISKRTGVRPAAGEPPRKPRPKAKRKPAPKPPAAAAQSAPAPQTAAAPFPGWPALPPGWPVPPWPPFAPSPGGATPVAPMAWPMPWPGAPQAACLPAGMAPVAAAPAPPQTGKEVAAQAGASPVAEVPPLAGPALEITSGAPSETVQKPVAERPAPPAAEPATEPPPAETAPVEAATADAPPAPPPAAESPATPPETREAVAVAGAAAASGEAPSPAVAVSAPPISAAIAKQPEAAALAPRVAAAVPPATEVTPAPPPLAPPLAPRLEAPAWSMPAAPVPRVEAIRPAPLTWSLPRPLTEAPVLPARRVTPMAARPALRTVQPAALPSLASGGAAPAPLRRRAPEEEAASGAAPGQGRSPPSAPASEGESGKEADSKDARKT